VTVTVQSHGRSALQSKDQATSEARVPHECIRRSKATGGGAASDNAWVSQLQALSDFPCAGGGARIIAIDLRPLDICRYPISRAVMIFVVAIRVTPAPHGSDAGSGTKFSGPHTVHDGVVPLHQIAMRFGRPLRKLKWPTIDPLASTTRKLSGSRSWSCTRIAPARA
jgi:hypothetical protein